MLAMLVIAMFAVLVLALDAVGAAIASLFESTSEWASLLVFLGFFVVNFIIAWKGAVYLIDRFFLTDSQRKANEEHSRWVNSIYAKMLAADRATADRARSVSHASAIAQPRGLETAAHRLGTR